MAGVHTSAYWKNKYETWQVDTRYYGDIETYRVYTALFFVALVCLFVSVVVFGFCFLKGAKSKRNKETSIGVIMFIVLFVQAYYGLPTTKILPRSQLRTGLVIENVCFYSPKGGKMTESTRDCHYGEKAVCSIAEPCTPCNPTAGLDKIVMFNLVNNIFRGEHCRRCGGANYACPTDVNNAKSFCKQSAYLSSGADGRTVDGDFTGTAAGWETTEVEECSACCTTNRTLVFFAERGLSSQDGAQNIGTWKNASISGSTSSAAFDTIYAEIQTMLEADPHYFLNAVNKPLATMNYTTKFGIPCNEPSWNLCY